jgi:hypothetical protein
LHSSGTTTINQFANGDAVPGTLKTVTSIDLDTGWRRRLTAQSPERRLELGHTVRIIPAQFAKPFVKSNKNE